MIQSNQKSDDNGQAYSSNNSIQVQVTADFTNASITWHFNQPANSQINVCNKFW